MTDTDSTLWEKHQDADGNVYWYNTETAESQWENPNTSSTLVNQANSDREGWLLLQDDASKKWYYYQESTGAWEWKTEEESSDAVKPLNDQGIVVKDMAGTKDDIFVSGSASYTEFMAEESKRILRESALELASIKVERNRLLQDIKEKDMRMQRYQSMLNTLRPSDGQYATDEDYTTDDEFNRAATDMWKARVSSLLETQQTMIEMLAQGSRELETMRQQAEIARAAQKQAEEALMSFQQYHHDQMMNLRDQQSNENILNSTNSSRTLTIETLGSPKGFSSAQKSKKKSSDTVKDRERVNVLQSENTLLQSDVESMKTTVADLEKSRDHYRDALSKANEKIRNLIAMKHTEKTSTNNSNGGDGGESSSNAASDETEAKASILQLEIERLEEELILEREKNDKMDEEKQALMESKFQQVENDNSSLKIALTEASKKIEMLESAAADEQSSKHAEKKMNVSTLRDEISALETKIVLLQQENKDLQSTNENEKQTSLLLLSPESPKNSKLVEKLHLEINSLKKQIKANQETHLLEIEQFKSDAKKLKEVNNMAQEDMKGLQEKVLSLEADERMTGWDNMVKEKEEMRAKITKLEAMNQSGTKKMEEDRANLKDKLSQREYECKEAHQKCEDFERTQKLLEKQLKSVEASKKKELQKLQDMYDSLEKSKETEMKILEEKLIVATERIEKGRTLFNEKNDLESKYTDASRQLSLLEKKYDDFKQSKINELENLQKEFDSYRQAKKNEIQKYNDQIAALQADDESEKWEVLLKENKKLKNDLIQQKSTSATELSIVERDLKSSVTNHEELKKINDSLNEQVQKLLLSQQSLEQKTKELKRELLVNEKKYHGLKETSEAELKQMKDQVAIDHEANNGRSAQYDNMVKEKVQLEQELKKLSETSSLKITSLEEKSLSLQSKLSEQEMIQNKLNDDITLLRGNLERSEQKCKSLERNKATAESMHNTVQGTLKKDNTSLNEKLSNLLIDLQSEEQKNKELSREKLLLEKKVTTLEESSQSQRQSLNERIEKLEGDIAEKNKKTLSNLEEIAKWKTEYENLKIDFAEIETSNRSTKNTMESLKSKLTEKSAFIEDTLKKHAAARENLTKKNEESQRMTKELAREIEKLQSETKIAIEGKKALMKECRNFQTLCEKYNGIKYYLSERLRQNNLIYTKRHFFSLFRKHVHTSKLVKAKDTEIRELTDVVAQKETLQKEKDEEYKRSIKNVKASLTEQRAKLQEQITRADKDIDILKSANEVKLSEFEQIQARLMKDIDMLKGDNDKLVKELADTAADRDSSIKTFKSDLEDLRRTKDSRIATLKADIVSLRKKTKEEHQAFEKVSEVARDERGQIHTLNLEIKTLRDQITEKEKDMMEKEEQLRQESDRRVNVATEKIRKETEEKLKETADRLNVSQSRIDTLLETVEEMIETHKLEIKGFKENKKSVAKSSVLCIASIVRSKELRKEQVKLIRVKEKTTAEEVKRREEQVHSLMKGHQNLLQEYEEQNELLKEVECQRDNYARSLKAKNEERIQQTRDMRMLIDTLTEEKGTQSLMIEDFKRTIDDQNGVINDLEVKVGKSNEMYAKIVEDHAISTSQISTLTARLQHEIRLRREVDSRIREICGNVRVFARICPPSVSLATLDSSADPTNAQIAVTVPLAEDGLSNSLSDCKLSVKRKRKIMALIATVCAEMLSNVQEVMLGAQMCVFVYGQTGTGKTYTMEGAVSASPSPSKYIADNTSMDRERKEGLVFRGMKELFRRIHEQRPISSSMVQQTHEKSNQQDDENHSPPSSKASTRRLPSTVTVSVRILEVYNEACYDLLHRDEDDGLSTGQNTRRGNSAGHTAISTEGGGELHRKEVQIKTVRGGVIVPDATVVDVSDFSNFLDVYYKSIANRSTGSHKLNIHSSRSHLVVTVFVKDHSDTTNTVGKLHFVDLAGSERLSKTEAKGARLKEARCINRSLSALGDVVMALSKGSRHIPYRNSRLTHLLSESLSAHSRVFMIITVSPIQYNLSETLCTLSFGERCRALELGRRYFKKSDGGHSATTNGPSRDASRLSSSTRIPSLKRSTSSSRHHPTPGDVKHVPPSSWQMKRTSNSAPSTPTKGRRYY
eukprot:g2854.t1